MDARWEDLSFEHGAHFLGKQKLSDILKVNNVFDVWYHLGPGSFHHLDTCLVYITGDGYVCALCQNGIGYLMGRCDSFRPNPESPLAQVLKKRKRIKDLEAEKAKLLAKLRPIRKELAVLKKEVSE